MKCRTHRLIGQLKQKSHDQIQPVALQTITSPEIGRSEETALSACSQFSIPVQQPIFYCPLCPNLPPTHSLFRTLSSQSSLNNFPLHYNYFRSLFWKVITQPQLGHMSHKSMWAVWQIETSCPHRQVYVTNNWRLKRHCCSFSFVSCIHFHSSRGKKIFVAKASTRRSLRVVILNPSHLGYRANILLRRQGGGQKSTRYLQQGCHRLLGLAQSFPSSISLENKQFGDISGLGLSHENHSPVFCKQ